MVDMAPMDGTIKHVIVPVNVVWEYKSVFTGTSPKQRTSVLDIHGRDGWELVTVDNMIMYFKRVKEE